MQYSTAVVASCAVRSISSRPSAAGAVQVCVPLERQRLQCVEGLVELGDDLVEVVGLRRGERVEQHVELQANAEQGLYDPVAERDEDVVGPILVDALRQGGAPDVAGRGCRASRTAMIVRTPVSVDTGLSATSTRSSEPSA